MTAVDLVSLFQTLVAPLASASGTDLSAVPIPGAETHRLAKDASGSPCLLIRQLPLTVPSAPIRLENLLVSFGVPCTITFPGRSQEQGTFTIVRCGSNNPSLFPHFLRIISPAVVALGPSPTPAAVRRAISALVELFQALSAPAKKTIQGLWAEILLIRLCRDPSAMAAAWHANPGEHFDFAAGPQRIEVKSSNCRRREHHFSLDQLIPIGGSRIVIASLFVERSGGGVALQKLFDDTRGLLAGDLAIAARFDAVFYASVGSGWSDGLAEAFDWEVAVDSIAYYDAETVPRVDNPAPQLVFDVGFRSDLGSSPPLERQQLLDSGGLFAVGIPAR